MGRYQNLKTMGQGIQDDMELVLVNKISDGERRQLSCLVPKEKVLVVCWHS